MYIVYVYVQYTYYICVIECIYIRVVPKSKFFAMNSSVHLNGAVWA